MLSTQGKTTSRGLTTCCSPHMKAITVLLYRKYSKMFITWIVICRRQQNNFRYSKYNYGSGLKKIFSTHFLLSGIVDRATTYYLPLYYICFDRLPGYLPHKQIFRETSKLSLIFLLYSKKKYVRWNNTNYWIYVQIFFFTNFSYFI